MYNGTQDSVVGYCYVVALVNLFHFCLRVIPGLDIKLVDAVARGASRFENLLAPLKTYWPPKN